jgi:4-methyl-5(b-hydroxyethyl)-thiazole monophosphate biosynthesis
MLSKNILVPVANGIEELECVTIIDVLRRAGLAVRVSSIENREITGANGIKIIADSEFIDEVIEDYDAIILPGGTEGAEHFYDYTPLVQALTSFASTNKLIGAICASPALVLARAGLLDSKRATCYPALKAKLKHYSTDAVIVDGNIITSQGPGTALTFALKLAEILAGAKIAQDIKAAMLA